MIFALSAIAIDTDLGAITLALRRDAAPRTCDNIVDLVSRALYDGMSFYRSDFVVQMGLHGSGRTVPNGDLSVNETHSGVRVSNTRGTAAVAHWDVPDCGTAEFFINLKANSHLDEAYGGYCVFAQVADGDATSQATMVAVAEAVKRSGQVTVKTVRVV